MEEPAADMGVPQLELPVLLWLRQPLLGRCAKLRLRVRSRAHLTQHVVDVVFSRMGPEQVRHLWSVAAIPPVCCCNLPSVRSWRMIPTNWRRRSKELLILYDC